MHGVSKKEIFETICIYSICIIYNIYSAQPGGVRAAAPLPGQPPAHLRHRVRRAALGRGRARRARGLRGHAARVAARGHGHRGRGAHRQQLRRLPAQRGQHRGGYKYTCIFSVLC